VRQLVDVPPLDPWVSAVHVDGDGNVVVAVTIEGAQVGISVYNTEPGQPDLIMGVRSTDAAVVDAKSYNERYGYDNTVNLWLCNTFATADPPCLLEWPRTIRARPWLHPVSVTADHTPTASGHAVERLAC
jgi:hypothetical protein